MSASAAEHNVATASPVPAGRTLRFAPGSSVTFRDRVVVAVLSFATLGIYTVFWWYFINREMADRGRAQGRHELGHDPTTSTLALFPGAIVVVPALWTVTTFQRIQAAQRLHGQVPINGWIGLLLALVLSPALHGYMQGGLNSAWSAAHEGTWQLLS